MSKLKLRLKKIRQFHQKQRRIPTLEEMSKLFKFASKRSAFMLVEKMVDAGLIEKDSKGHVSIGETIFPLPVLVMIPAGFPIDVDKKLEPKEGMWLLPELMVNLR